MNRILLVTSLILSFISGYLASRKAKKAYENGYSKGMFDQWLQSEVLAHLIWNGDPTAEDSFPGLDLDMMNREAKPDAPLERVRKVPFRYQVVHPDTGRAIEGAQVRILDTYRETGDSLTGFDGYTDAFGEARDENGRIPRLLPGIWWVHVYKFNMPHEPKRIIVPAEEDESA